MNSQRMLRVVAACVWGMAFGPAEMAAQEETVPDTLPPHRYTTHAMLFGAGLSNQYDTYLSPVEYRGPQLSFLRESLRRTHWADGKITVQGMLHGYVAYTENRAETANELAGNVGYSAGWHYNWTPLPGLRLMAGGQIGGQLGFLYNLRNSNNPAQARAAVDVAASGLALYTFRIRRQTLGLRYQLDIPLLGAMFSPNYGQSYYELFSLGHYDHNVCFTHPGNAPSFRQLLTMDFPIGGFTFRAGYLCDIRQSRVNGLRAHTYNHTFLFGYVKHFAFLKRKDKAAKHFIP